MRGGELAYLRSGATVPRRRHSGIWLLIQRQGMLNEQIAYGCSETTVKAHVSEILCKLNVYSRTQAVIEVSKLDNAELFRDQAGF